MDDVTQVVDPHSQPVAIEALLVKFLPGLRAFLARQSGGVVGHKESPDDLAQSICREVLERWQGRRLTFQGEAQFHQWLWQAATHKLQNRRRFYRAGRRNTAREQRVDRDASAAGSRAEACFAHLSTPSKQAVRREDLALLGNALAALPEPQRQIILLARVDGLSHAELAERLGVTESHSRVLLARAMARLVRVAQFAEQREIRERA